MRRGVGDRGVGVGEGWSVVNSVRPKNLKKYMKLNLEFPEGWGWDCGGVIDISCPEHTQFDQ